MALLFQVNNHYEANTSQTCQTPKCWSKVTWKVREKRGLNFSIKTAEQEIIIFEVPESVQVAPLGAHCLELFIYPT